MPIINPLPYNIANGDPVDATPVTANFTQIVNDVNSGAAAVGGLASQEFFVAPTVNPAGAIPLLQAQGQFATLNGNSGQVFNVATAVTNNEAVPLGQITAPSPNLLVNGSAELGSLAWTLPSQAGYATGVGGEGTYFGISSAVNGTYVATSADYAVTPGVALTLQAEIFASGLTAGDLVMDLEFLDSTHTPILSNQAQSSVSADQTWTFTSASATTPANTAYWHARIFMQNATLTNGAFRKIKVSGGTAASPYSREADFPAIQANFAAIAQTLGAGASAYVDQTGSRALSTAYTNTTGRPLVVCVQYAVQSPTQSAIAGTILVGMSAWSTINGAFASAAVTGSDYPPSPGGNYSYGGSAMFIVPPNGVYMARFVPYLTSTVSPSYTWFEY
jgi:hypothetical protein